MKRVLMLCAVNACAVAAACGLLAAGLAGARSAHPTLALHRTKLGMILVDSRGFTVYAFTRDRRNRDVCVAIRGCIAVWPPVRSAGRPILGPGVRASLVGRIRVRGVGEQLTYAGHPLYTYIADRHPAQTTWVDFFQFGGRWPALSAAGRELK